MAVQQQTIAQPAAQRHLPLALMASVGAAMVVSALALAFVMLPARPAASVGTGQIGSPEWQTFRAGEREYPPVAAGIGSDAWRDFRVGEREAAPVDAGVGSDAWRAFRAEELQYPTGSSGDLGSDEWRAFRVGEREIPAADPHTYLERGQ